MGGGLSIGPGGAQRRVGNEVPQIDAFFRNQLGRFNSFFENQPLFQQAQGFLGQTAGAVPQQNLGGLEGSIPMGNTGPALQQAETLTSSLHQFNDPVLASGGALTPEQERDVSQRTRGVLGAQGNLHGNQALGSELLNRQQFRDDRYNTALSRQAGGIQTNLGVENQQFGQQQGIFSDLFGLKTGQFGQGQSQFGDIESLIGQSLGIEQGGIQGFEGIMDPSLSYLGNLFGGNLQAAISTQLANQNKGAALPGTAGSVLGNIIGAIGLSDKRLKTKIKSIGEKTPEGIPIKSFQFKDDPSNQRFIGVIAQDVQKKAPHAVGETGGGFLGVDFGQIHAPYHKIGGPHAARGAGGGRGRGGDPGIEPGALPGTGPFASSNPKYEGNTPSPHNVRWTDLQDLLGDSFDDYTAYELKNMDQLLGGFSFSPPAGTPGFLQGPTLIPSQFDPQGYPYAQPVGPDFNLAGVSPHMGHPRPQ